MQSASKRLFDYYAARPALREVLVAITIIGLCFLFASPGTADAKSGSTTLTGATSQGQPAVIRLSSSGQMISEVSTTVQLQCSDGQEKFPMFVPEKWHLIPVKPGGAFKENAEAPVVEPDGSSVLVRVSFTGKFNRARTGVTAKLRNYVTIHDPDGTALTCDSGVVRLHAQS